jgi:hypothetical protein
LQEPGPTSQKYVSQFKYCIFELTENIYRSPEQIYVKFRDWFIKNPFANFELPLLEPAVVTNHLETTAGSKLRANIAQIKLSKLPAVPPAPPAPKVFAPGQQTDWKSSATVSFCK